MSIDTSTSVDVLIERLQTHPEEFFDKTRVSVRGAEDIVFGTKWQRITSLLWADEPQQTNLWYDMFTSDERERFKAAFVKAVRAELDAQITNRLINGAEFEDVAQEIALKQAHYVAQQKQAQLIIQKTAAAQRQLGGLLGTAGSAYGDMRLMDKYDQWDREAMRIWEEQERAQKLAEAQYERSGLIDTLKSWI